MNNEVQIAQQQLPTLAEFSARLDLVAIRRDPVGFPRIKATPRPEAVARMSQIVYAAFLYRNQPTTKEALAFTATALVDEIMADAHFGLQSLSWKEIGMVIRRAVLGGAKELYGVSVSTLYAALVDYAKTEGHEAAKQAF